MFSYLYMLESSVYKITKSLYLGMANDTDTSLWIARFTLLTLFISTLVAITKLYNSTWQLSYKRRQQEVAISDHDNPTIQELKRLWHNESEFRRLTSLTLTEDKQSSIVSYAKEKGISFLNLRALGRGGYIDTEKVAVRTTTTSTAYYFLCWGTAIFSFVLLFFTLVTLFKAENILQLLTILFYGSLVIWWISFLGAEIRSYKLARKLEKQDATKDGSKGQAERA